MVKKRGVGAAALADGDSDIQASHRFEKPRDSQRSAVQRRESTTADEFNDFGLRRVVVSAEESRDPLAVTQNSLRLHHIGEDRVESLYHPGGREHWGDFFSG